MTFEGQVDASRFEPRLPPSSRRNPPRQPEPPTWARAGRAKHAPFGALVGGLLGVLIFAGLTAYDTQRLKESYVHVAGSDLAGKVVIMGALSLYLDFVNLFQFLLSFMGDRR